MNKEELIKLGLTEEQATKVLEAAKTQLEGFIPKSRFDEVNTAKIQLEKDIVERDKQLTTLKKDVGDNETLKQTITDLQTANKTAADNYAVELATLKLNSAIDTALVGHKAKNIKAVKGLIDTSKISLDGENLLGLDEQLKTLKEAEDSKFLFEEVKTEITPPAGTAPGASNTAAAAGTTTKNMSYEEIVKHLEANPGAKL